MRLVEEIDRLRNTLTRIPSVELGREERTGFASGAETTIVEDLLRRPLPPALRETWERYAASLRFSWRVQGDAFGLSCRRGFLQLMSPSEVVSSVQELRSIAADTQRSGIDGDGEFAFQSDWPFWIPIFCFPSGDAFCLDIRDRAGADRVVFLEHDVMDGGPNVHGIQLAPSFDELITRWSEVAFVELYDWSPGISPDGIDPGAPAFTRLRQQLARASAEN